MRLHSFPLGEAVQGTSSVPLSERQTANIHVNAIQKIDIQMLYFCPLSYIRCNIVPLAFCSTSNLRLGRIEGRWNGEDRGKKERTRGRAPRVFDFVYA